MAKVKNESNLRRYAIMGARARIQELLSEIDNIKKQFGARTLSAAASGESPFPWGPRSGREVKVAPRRRRKMSADARKRISEAQKARWAKKKAGKKR